MAPVDRLDGLTHADAGGRRRSQMKFRPTESKDLEETYAVRARTRQNPMSKAQLVSAGFDPESVLRNFETGEYVGWVCEEGNKVVGFATGDTTTGEVLVVAVLPEYEGKKVGKNLLARLVDSMTERGCSSLWLEASSDPKVRAYGFYRALGWVPTGRTSGNGDEVLELKRARLPGG